MKYEVTIREKVKKGLFNKEEVERKIGFTFTIEMWMMLSDYTQLAPLDWGQMESESFLIKMYYCACRMWHLEQGKEQDFDEGDVERWIEEGLNSKQIKELADVFVKSKIGGESLQDLIPRYVEKPEDEKKKQRGMKLQTTP